MIPLHPRDTSRNDTRGITPASYFEAQGQAAVFDTLRVRAGWYISEDATFRRGNKYWSTDSLWLFLKSYLTPVQPSLYILNKRGNMKKKKKKGLKALIQTTHSFRAWFRMCSAGVMQIEIGTLDLFSFRLGPFCVCIEDFGAGFACTWFYLEYRFSILAVQFFSCFVDVFSLPLSQDQGNMVSLQLNTSWRIKQLHFKSLHRDENVSSRLFTSTICKHEATGYFQTDLRTP